ncbi:hypothetical protein H4582DRAFT_133647 [Lactarius indigo]|nr:hypothetical protein H4582DRAFT_133647 [Lactarius indigo]
MRCKSRALVGWVPPASGCDASRVSAFPVTISVLIFSLIPLPLDAERRIRHGASIGPSFGCIFQIIRSGISDPLMQRDSFTPQLLTASWHVRFSPIDSVPSQVIPRLPVQVISLFSLATGTVHQKCFRRCLRVGVERAVPRAGTSHFLSAYAFTCTS